MATPQTPNDTCNQLPAECPSLLVVERLRSFSVGRQLLRMQLVDMLVRRQLHGRRDRRRLLRPLLRVQARYNVRIMTLIIRIEVWRHHRRRRPSGEHRRIPRIFLGLRGVWRSWYGCADAIRVLVLRVLCLLVCFAALAVEEDGENDYG